MLECHGGCVTQLMSEVHFSTYFGCNETLGILTTTFVGTSSTKLEAACWHPGCECTKGVGSIFF